MGQKWYMARELSIKNNRVFVGIWQVPWYRMKR